jgi:hypothetical protein
MRGLKSSTQVQVNYRRSTNLTETIQVAETYDRSHFPKQIHEQIAKTNNNPSSKFKGIEYPRHRKPSPLPSERPKFYQPRAKIGTITDRERARCIQEGRCFRCTKSQNSSQQYLIGSIAEDENPPIKKLNSIRSPNSINNISESIKTGCYTLPDCSMRQRTILSQNTSCKMELLLKMFNIQFRWRTRNSL